VACTAERLLLGQTDTCRCNFDRKSPATADKDVDRCSAIGGEASGKIPSEDVNVPRGVTTSIHDCLFGARRVWRRREDAQNLSSHENSNHVEEPSLPDQFIKCLGMQISGGGSRRRQGWAVHMIRRWFSETGSASPPQVTWENDGAGGARSRLPFPRTMLHPRAVPKRTRVLERMIR
jgi:hypothetical protein